MTVAERDDRPNIIVFGVGHSGTTLLAKMLFSLGWSQGESSDAADEEYGEHRAIRQCNRCVLEHQAIPPEAGSVLQALKSPWAIKDPRFVLTLPSWQPVFASVLGQLPMLLWIIKDLEEVKQSHAIRGEMLGDQPGSHQHTVDDLWQLAVTHYENWPGPKLRVCYRQIVAAATLWLPERAPGGPDLLRQRNREVAHLQEALASHASESQASISSLKDTLQQRKEQVAALHSKIAQYAHDNEAQTKTINSLKDSLRQREEQAAELHNKISQYARDNVAQTKTILALKDKLNRRVQPESNV